MNHQVFISYSSKDRNVADKVLAMLESRNIKCWMAPRDIIGGVEYGDVIDKAILNCKAVVVIFSAYSQQSQWVKGELNLGFSYHKAIVPYRIDDTVLQGAMRLMLNDKHWIDANPSTDYKWNDLLEAVAVALEISMPEQVASP
ncbi:MAG: toll/interleukin-1 receptor domain-containing protein, partial [Oscillospiraceae bacterium]|nr:toll/interleukin-1 receptor domain-containing protein [Oscillospiraceae bacterium]